jgi:site-specific recombinase XerD
MTEEVISDFLDEKSDLDESWYGTCRRMTEHLDGFLDQEDLDPQQIEFRGSDIEDFQDYLQKNTDWANSTIKNHVMAFRELVKFAYENRYGWDAVFQKGNPLSIYSADLDDGLAWEEETGEEIPYITEEEHELLLEENENPRDEILLRTLWDTGCRPSELRRLTLSEIDKTDLIEDRKITVQTAKREDHQRDVYLSPTTRSKWVFWLYKGKRDAYGNSSHSSDYVFPTQRTENMSQGMINLQIKRLADRADIQTVGYELEAKNYLRGEMVETTREMVELNSKAYRHSFAVRACKNGINLNLLAELMGHADSSSLSSYTKFLPNDKKEAWERFIH